MMGSYPSIPLFIFPLLGCCVCLSRRTMTRLPFSLVDPTRTVPAFYPAPIEKMFQSSFSLTIPPPFFQTLLTPKHVLSEPIPRGHRRRRRWHRLPLPTHRPPGHPPPFSHIHLP